MEPHDIVSPEAWREARRALLAQEKALTQARDAVSRARRALPWTRLDKSYVFEGTDGAVTLADLFGDARQLIVVHFMFGPDATVGCPVCSLRADGLDAMIPHLKARDVALAVVSRGRLAAMNAFKARMGWRFPWVSSLGGDFGSDFGVSLAAGPGTYNYARRNGPAGEANGTSVFYRDPADGAVFHTYSTYARGDDILMSPYNYLDLTPKGRDEGALPWSSAWIRHHDSYGTPPA